MYINFIDSYTLKTVYLQRKIIVWLKGIWYESNILYLTNLWRKTGGIFCAGSWQQCYTQVLLFSYPPPLLLGFKVFIVLYGTVQDSSIVRESLLPPLSIVTMGVTIDLLLVFHFTVEGVGEGGEGSGILVVLGIDHMLLTNILN